MRTFLHHSGDKASELTLSGQAHGGPQGVQVPCLGNAMRYNGAIHQRKKPNMVGLRGQPCQTLVSDGTVRPILPSTCMGTV